MSTHARQHARPTQQQQQARPQMAQRPARRLPPARRLDYILIPAPLDLSLSSLSTLSEKSPLPSIIVTPSSPTHFGSMGGDFGVEGRENENPGREYEERREYEYAIAFMVQPKPPSVFQRVVGSVKDGVERGVQRVKQAVPIPARWTWRRGGYAPIALPISAPATQTEFTIPTFPPEKRKTNKVLVVLTAVFVLVFCHMLAHFFTRALLPSSIPLSSSNFDLGSTSPVLPSAGYMVPATLPNVEGGVIGGGVKAKADAFLGKMEVKQWLAWMVGGAGRKRGGDA
ncbi:hypothetical protein FA13DRAFT_1793087 [Coprinellus micaceus]|uniref:Uncharacterized protein n=1 Tax=Coprinellus micaceus TaxID=71717 RepID=A0A4Y7T615_COPMI|nr:hypothetical protein FA13DRAFT_1793087 [Coprinellus micaceus]